MAMTDWHEKPPADVRSVDDAIVSAEIKRRDLPHVVQVYARDWDTVILVDEIRRLRVELQKSADQYRTMMAVRRRAP